MSFSLCAVVQSLIYTVTSKYHVIKRIENFSGDFSFIVLLLASWGRVVGPKQK